MKAVTLVAAVCTLVLPLRAQSPALKEFEAVLRKYDTNKDGYLGFDEMKDKDLFKKLDKNGDRRITVADFLPGAAPPKADAAMAALPEYDGFQSLPRFDKNHDGVLDDGELRGLLFSICNRSKDGYLTEHEARTSPPPPACTTLTDGWLTREMKEMDRNGDQLIEMKEFRVPEAWLHAVDRNHDGRLSFDELARAEVEVMGGYIAHYQELSAIAGQKQKIDKANWLGEPGLFQRLDENNDGVVSLQEFDRYARKLRAVLALASDFITRFDLDGDGKVSRAEFPGNDAVFARLDRNGDGYVSIDDR